VKNKKTINNSSCIHSSKKRRAGLSLVEILISLSVAALLLTATAAAFDAAFKNLQENNEMAMVGMSTRNSLCQMTGTIRSAWNDPDTATIDVNSTGTEISLTDATGQNIIYRYDANTQQLQVNVNGNANWYPMIEDVYPAGTGIDIFTATAPQDTSFPAGTVGCIDIRFRVTRDNTCRTICASVVPRNIIY